MRKTKPSLLGHEQKDRDPLLWLLLELVKVFWYHGDEHSITAKIDDDPAGTSPSSPTHHGAHHNKFMILS